MTGSNKKTGTTQYDQYSWTENRLRTLVFITSPIGIGIFLVASIRQAGIIKLQGIKLLRFGASLETIAAFFGSIGFLSMCIGAYILYKRSKQKSSSQTVTIEMEPLSSQNENTESGSITRKGSTDSQGSTTSTASQKEQPLLPAPNKLARTGFYIECAGIIVLTAMQIGIAIDLWTTNIISDAHKKIGLKFDIQTIFDTIGLSLLLVGMVIGKYNKYQKFKEADKVIESDGKQKKATASQKLGLGLSIAVPLIGFSLNLLGKILIGFEGSKQLIIPIEDGRFPLALVLRMTGACILLLFAVYEVGTQLNEPVVESGVSGGIAGGIL